MNTNDKLINDFLAHLGISSPKPEQINFLRTLPEEDMIKPVAYALRNKGRKIGKIAQIYGFDPQQIYHRMRKIYESMNEEMQEENEEITQIENNL